ncbi:tail fiber assembly protein [Pseudomonas sp. KB_15]|uniref:tail fiber assembly protein n=1 Tax=Pseudomonas sp. KB_15 TaxID=3233035 RepID=UPI003F9CF425
MLQTRLAAGVTQLPVFGCGHTTALFLPHQTPYQTPPEEIAALNEAQRQAFLVAASQAMAPILVSLQLGDATDDETLNAKAWQAYYRELKLVDVTVAKPSTTPGRWPNAWATRRRLTVPARSIAGAA